MESPNLKNPLKNEDVQGAMTSAHSPNEGWVSAEEILNRQNCLGDC